VKIKLFPASVRNPAKTTQGDATVIPLNPFGSKALVVVTGEKEMMNSVAHGGDTVDCYVTCRAHTRGTL
jgi:hypothetical protein